MRGLALAVTALAALTLGACETTSSGPPPRAEVILPEPVVPPQEQIIVNQNPAGYVNAHHMAGREPVRVALLLPLGHHNPQTRAIADSMRDAAELAIFRSGRSDILLLTKDTRGTVLGAENAAREAVAQGAELILGPLFADNVRAVAPIARAAQLSVVAFSSDSQVATNDVYLLGFTPEQEVTRVTEYALSQGHFDFAALVPMNDYGNRVDYTFSNTVSRYGGYVVQSLPYDRGSEDFRHVAGSLAATYGSVGIGEEVDLGNNAPQLSDGGQGFTAVLLPEGGTTLRLLAPSLPYNNIDNRVVRFLGTGLWDDQRLWREPALNHGWFAAPDPEMRNRFSVAFETVYAESPHRLASLAYDGVTLAASLANGPRGQRYTRARLTNPSGFAGVDGIFRFLPGGATDRGLAVLEVDDGEVSVASPAPVRFGPVRTESSTFPARDTMDNRMDDGTGDGQDPFDPTT